VRFWTPEETRRRALVQQTLVDCVERTLLDLNQMWRVVQVETPAIMPLARMNKSYSRDDVFLLMDSPAGTEQWGLRPETTDGSYLAAEWLLRNTTMRAPLCVWQTGRSYRRETSDGATAAKLRFNEFQQLEFQCLYGETTQAPIAEALRAALQPCVERLTGRHTRVVPSDRLPAYATETLDLEVLTDAGQWREVASTSRRTDFPAVPGLKYQCQCFEVAFGLDRMVELSTGGSTRLPAPGRQEVMAE
jgi:glycyl-tRNA synthetase